MKIIDAATEWWVKKIKSPNNFDNGENDPVNFKVRMMVSSLVDVVKDNLTEEQIVNFKEILSDFIESEIKENDFCELNVDYRPEGLLAKAVALFKVPKYFFPLKTKMQITSSEVAVSESGRNYVTIYSKYDDDEELKAGIEKAKEVMRNLGKEETTISDIARLLNVSEERITTAEKATQKVKK